VRAAAREVEALGYGALWTGEAIGREVMSAAQLLLGATDTLVVATGIANIWARDAYATSAAQLALGEAYPDRFVLGIGASHKLLMDVRGGDYLKPLAFMRSYLDGMDAGAEIYFVPPEHTARAREILGGDKLLVPEQVCVLAAEPSVAREIARRHTSSYLRLGNYTANLQRFGFEESDFADGGNDRLVDTICAWGDVDVIAGRVQAHLDAGADHVAVQVLVDDRFGLPRKEWAELAPALLAL
jgi:alkanesulfonate monooxygenase SsuD/methylene tetrahydromethanopterin reductase-like flavin-dependent oxidoreductase (luciferase family)